jgi:CheY-like chemotaxis protein
VPKPPKLITTHDLAKWIHVDPSSISKWIDKGIILAFRTPGGHRRIRQHDAVEFLRKQGMPIPPELTDAGDSPQGTQPDIHVEVDRRGPGRPKLLLLDDVHWFDESKAALDSAFQLTATTSPLEAMLLLAEQRPPFVLVELNLKGISGLEVVKTIREHETLKQVRVATMTALPSAIAEKKSKAAGAEACFAKPLTLADVNGHFIRDGKRPRRS